MGRKNEKNIEKLRFFKLLRTITTRSGVDKDRIPDVFKWSKGFGRYFNAADDIFNFSSFFRCFGGTVVDSSDHNKLLSMT